MVMVKVWTVCIISFFFVPSSKPISLLPEDFLEKAFNSTPLDAETKGLLTPYLRKGMQAVKDLAQGKGNDSSILQTLTNHFGLNSGVNMHETRHSLVMVRTIGIVLTTTLILHDICLD